MLQARQLGNELLVGVHSDESIMENKGPTVMRLDERCVLARNMHTLPQLIHQVLRPLKPAAGSLARSQKPPM